MAADLEEAGFGQGRVWQVGPEREHKTPSAVADRVGDGDVVLIDAATYACDAGVVWRADRLTLKGVGGRPHLAAEGCDIPGGKGIWNPAGTDLLIDNIEFSGAAVSDENGAGIRFEGDGRVIIKNSFFHDNENGILFTPPFGDSTDLLIEYSEFAYNGVSSGQSHNLYINGGRSLTFRYNYSHDSHVGHLLKSRTANNYILYNRLATMDGIGSYEIDLPFGGDAWIIGNIIEQGAVSENRGIIAFGTEVEPGTGGGREDGSLYLINNTIVNDNPNGADLITLIDYAFKHLQVTNNLLVDIPQGAIDVLEDRGAVFDHNLVTHDPGFRDRGGYNYALTAGSPATGAGIDPGNDHLGKALLPDRRYRHPLAVEPRADRGVAVDLGALEYRDTVPDTPVVALEAADTAIDYGADADLRWTAQGAERCLATGDWGGPMATTGEAGIGPLNQAASFKLTCDGEGGTGQATVAVAVADNPLAASYPDYRFTELAGTAIHPLCQEAFPYRGVGDCTDREMSAAYVPEQNAYYLFGGADRSYFGNEVIRLDLDKRDLQVVFGPTDPRETKNFNPDHEGAWDMIGDCRGVWDLKDGGVAPAPSRVYSSWIYAPSAGKIFKNSGRPACGTSWFDTDSWWFDPENNGWQLLEREGGIYSDGTHAVYDPDSGQILIIGEQAVYRFDPAKEDLVELGPYNDVVWSTTPVLDPENDVIVIIGKGEYQHSKFTVIDVRGVDADAKHLPAQQRWTATGDLSLLDMNSPGLAYDPDRKVVVGWGGGPKLYFLAIDRAARRIEFIARKLDDAPAFTWPKRNTFLYAEKEKAFVAYAGADSNFYLLQARD